MRFGIMALQADMLIPPEVQSLPSDRALARMAAFDHAGMVRRLHEQGFDPIEIGGDLAMILPHTFSPAAMQGLADLKAELGLSYTVHLPLWSVEASTMLDPVRQGSVEALVKAIQSTRLLQPEVYVLHATGALAAEFYRMSLPSLAHAFVLHRFQTNAGQSIQETLESTGLSPRQVALETIEFPFELTLELAEELDLSICFDTGHMLAGLAGPVDLFEALECCLPRLAEVHLHDAPRHDPQRKALYSRDHMPLGAGDLDVGRFLDCLSAAHFNGPLILELQVAKALASLDLIRSLRPNVLTT